LKKNKSLRYSSEDLSKNTVLIKFYKKFNLAMEKLNNVLNFEYFFLFCGHLMKTEDSIINYFYFLLKFK